MKYVSFFFTLILLYILVPLKPASAATPATPPEITLTTSCAATGPVVNVKWAAPTPFYVTIYRWEGTDPAGNAPTYVKRANLAATRDHFTDTTETFPVDTSDPANSQTFLAGTPGVKSNTTYSYWLASQGNDNEGFHSQPKVIKTGDCPTPIAATCSVQLLGTDETSDPNFNIVSVSFKGKGGGLVQLWMDQKGTPLPGTDFGTRGFLSANYGLGMSPADIAYKDKATLNAYSYKLGTDQKDPNNIATGLYWIGKTQKFPSNIVTTLNNPTQVDFSIYQWIRQFTAGTAGFDVNGKAWVYHYNIDECDGTKTECGNGPIKVKIPKADRAWFFCGVRSNTNPDILQCIGNPVCSFNGGPDIGSTKAVATEVTACAGWKRSCDTNFQSNTPPANTVHTDYVSYDPSNLCTPGAMCPDGSICKADGTCGGACDSTTNKCPTGNVCDTTTGKCGPGCTKPGSVCNNGQICQADGSCSPCTNSNQCSATQICSSGTCVDACTGQKPTNDCKVLVADGHTCSEKDAPDGSTCNNNNGTCKSGVCIDICKEDANCKNGQVCQLPDGICVDACKNDNECKNGNLCINNRCLPPVKTALKFDLLLQRIGKNTAGDSSGKLPDANTNPKTPTRELTAEIFSNADATAPVAIARGPITYNATSGTFQGSIPLRMDIPTGDYIVKIKTDRYLRKKFNGTVKITKDQENAVPSEVLIVGDIVTDNEVNILDYNTWVDCANPELPLSKTMADASSKYSSPACTSHPEKANADLDDDGYVSAYDFNILLQNLGIRFGD